MNFIKLIDNKVFNIFLLWYNEEIENYKWIPVMPADRVNVFNQNDEMIAYKTFGLIDGKPVELYFAREDIWNKFLNN